MECALRLTTGPLVKWEKGEAERQKFLIEFGINHFLHSTFLLVCLLDIITVQDHRSHLP